MASSLARSPVFGWSGSRPIQTQHTPHASARVRAYAACVACSQNMSSFFAMWFPHFATRMLRVLRVLCMRVCACVCMLRVLRNKGRLPWFLPLCRDTHKDRPFLSLCLVFSPRSPTSIPDQRTAHNCFLGPSLLRRTFHCGERVVLSCFLRG